MSKTYNSLTQTQLTTVFYIFIYEAWRRYVFPFSPPGNVLQAVWQNNCGRFDAGYVRNQKKTHTQRMEQQTMAKWNVPEKNKNDEKF